jgi:hypothetical protein
MLQQLGAGNYVYAFVVAFKRQLERRIQMNAASTIRDHPATLKNLAEGGSRAPYFAPATTRPSPNIRLDMATAPTRGVNTEGRSEASPVLCPVKTSVG